MKCDTCGHDPEEPTDLEKNLLAKARVLQQDLWEAWQREQCIRKGPAGFRNTTLQAVYNAVVLAK